MKFRFFVWMVFLYLMTAINVFADISIKAEVDKTAISADETITYKLTVKSTEKRLPAPNLPGFKGFSILSQVQSSNISFAKGNTETSIIYLFVLAPQNEGRFSIGPSIIKFRGKEYSSESFEIEVKPGIEIPRQPKTKPPRESMPKDELPESDQPQYIL